MVWNPRLGIAAVPTAPIPLEQGSSNLTISLKGPVRASADVLAQLSIEAMCTSTCAMFVLGSVGADCTGHVPVKTTLACLAGGPFSVSEL